MDYGVRMAARSGKRVTIKDVAETAGVSITTVSHALNDKGEVNAETRRRVREAAAALGYRPNRAAQDLRGTPRKSVALILPRTDGSPAEAELIGLDYYLEIASACAGAAFAGGNSLVFPPPLETAEEWAQMGLDGVIICDPSEEDPRIDILESVGVPVVTIEPDAGRPDRPFYVRADTTASTVALLDHLKAAGARRIVLLWAESTWSWALETRAAYESWCWANGRARLVTPVPLVALELSAYRATIELLDGEAPPDAVFASAERYSTGVLQACRERGLRVPEDILVVGGVDGSTARLSDPAITAVDPRPTRLGAAAIDMLMERIQARAVTEPITVPSAIHLRASSTRARAEP